MRGIMKHLQSISLPYLLKSEPNQEKTVRCRYEVPTVKQESGTDKY